MFLICGKDGVNSSPEWLQASEIKYATALYYVTVSLFPMLT
jgi:hypothetical protein